jgi:transmembrane sensor
MKNIIEFPDRGLIEQEAVEWLIKLDGDPSPSEQDLQALREWMSRSPVHVEEIESLGAFWGDLIVLTELNIPLVKPAVMALTKEHQQGSAETVRSFVPRKAWAMAASVLGLALLLQQVLLPGWWGGERFYDANGHYATAIGKQASIPLADGSMVHLNTNSQIKIEYTERYRNIRLIQGEAHFDVAENKTQPFRVYAGQGRVEAVGTAFTVYLREKDIEVLVIEGKVELAAHKPTSISAAPISDKSMGIPTEVPDIKATKAVDNSNPEYYLTLPVKQLGLLTEGQGAIILAAQHNEPGDKQQGREVKLMDADTLKRRYAWRKGLLVFAGDSLEDVVAEISRYTTVSIEIIDPALKKIRIGGQFRVGDIHGMFDVLEANFGLNITLLENNRVQITAAEKLKNKNKMEILK